MPALEIGSSAALEVGDFVVVAGEGGRRRSLNARVTAKREFAGYWEYVLDEAVFTAPPHPNWGGCGLIDRHGRLVGIGSLLVRQAGAGGDDTLDGNMIVPIDLLTPILDDMQTLGRTQRPPRPWLGAYVTEVDEALVVAGLAPEGPAEQAELQVGDQVLAVNRQPVGSLVELFRSVWAVGEAGVAVPLTVMRNGEPHEVRVLSATRDEFMKTPQLH